MELLFQTSCNKGQLSSLEVPCTFGVKACIKPNFNAQINEYTLEIANDVSIVEVKAVAENIDDSVSINGIDTAAKKEVGDSTQERAVMVTLEEGQNKVEIAVQNLKSSEPNIYNLTIERADLSTVRDQFLDLSYTSEKTGITLPYRLYIPESYKKGTDKQYPIVLFLHGSGERGDDNQSQLNANLGATVWATDSVQVKQEMFVLAPQARNGGDDTGFGMTRVGDEINLKNVYTLSADVITAKEILNQVIAEYSIDQNRVYGTGLSQGAFGLWNLNLAYPDLFTAIVPIAGGGDETNPNLDKLIDQPIWVFHAAADPVIPVTEAQKIVDVLSIKGSSIKYTEYPVDAYFYPMAHMAWIPAYHDQKMIDWLISQSK